MRRVLAIAAVWIVAAALVVCALLGAEIALVLIEEAGAAIGRLIR